MLGLQLVIFFCLCFLFSFLVLFFRHPVTPINIFKNSILIYLWCLLFPELLKWSLQVLHYIYIIYQSISIIILLV